MNQIEIDGFHNLIPNEVYYTSNNDTIPIKENGCSHLVTRVSRFRVLSIDDILRSGSDIPALELINDMELYPSEHGSQALLRRTQMVYLNRHRYLEGRVYVAFENIMLDDRMVQVLSGNKTHLQNKLDEAFSPANASYWGIQVLCERDESISWSRVLHDIEIERVRDQRILSSKPIDLATLKPYLKVLCCGLEGKTDLLSDNTMQFNDSLLSTMIAIVLVRRYRSITWTEAIAFVEEQYTPRETRIT